jgi:S-methylmethionine-dependent homocysteine/selenocysteine methylase
MSFEQYMRTATFGLSEGSVYERLRRDSSIDFDPYLAHGALIYSDYGRRRLERIHREYLDVGQRYGLAMIAQTDTWCASLERIGQSKFDDRLVNQDNARFLWEIHSSYGTEAHPIFIAGLMGSRGDAYRPEEALSAADAESYHGYQAEALAEGGVDFLSAATLPAVSEACGLAAAMAKTALPYILSFVIRRDGSLLDGTPVAHAIETIDQSVRRPPIGYGINCTHPSVLMEALLTDESQGADISRRLLTFHANASSRDPAELDGLAELESEDPESLASLLYDIHVRFRIPFIGGCCGTDAKHIESLAVKHRGAQ